jgi:putative chromate ion transporter
VIEHLASDAADEALGRGVHFGCPDRDLDEPDSGSLRDAVEGGSELAFASRRSTLGASPSMVTFGSCCTVHSWVGFLLTATWTIRLDARSEAQLVDAVAIGQVTPGPVFTTATFVGYVLHGMLGAAVATVGIFLPSFVLVAVSGAFITWLRRSAIAGAFLDGVNVASLGLMAAASSQLARAAVRDVLTALIALASLVLLLRFRVNSTWLVLGGAIVGILLATRP